jgi:hypothetical protein
MAQKENVFVNVVTEFDGKALLKGKKQLSEFDKNVNKLGKTFAKTFAGYKLLQFGKASVNAFIASEKAAAQLRTTVDNLGLSYQQPAIADYIKKLELQYGIVDENLIPGFQRLLVATKDVSQAQSIFQTALDISAATGKDLTEVSTVLSKAYMGDTTALARLGIGFSKAQLKGAKFLEIQKQANVIFKGQASAAASGYVGELKQLNRAVDQSKEAIGKGLLDALKTLSGDTSIDTFTAKMVALADTLGRFINNAAGFAKVTANIFNVKDPNFFRIQPKTVAPGASTARVKDYQLTVKTTAARKAELAIITKSNTAKTEIDKLKDKFDMERIQLTAALNAATDEETKLRLRAQLAILDNNEALAKKLLAEMNAAEAAKKLAEAAKNATDPLNAFGRAVSEMAATLNMQNKALQDEKMGKSSYVSSSPTFTNPGNSPTYAPFTGSIGELSSTLNFLNNAAQDEKMGKASSYVINIDATSMIDPANMTKVVQQAFIDINKNGYSTAPAGQGF